MKVVSSRFLLLNAGHAMDHLFMLLYPTVVLSLESEFQRPYAELLPLSVGGFIAFGAGALPAGWLGDRWSRRNMMIVFFVGIGLSSILTGLTDAPWQLAVGLTLIGLFASIYHPVGVALVVQDAEKVGKLLGINGVFGNLGVAGATLTAGALATLIHWRAAFIIPGLVAVAAGVYFAMVFKADEARKAAPSAGAKAALNRASLVRVFAVLAASTLLGGFIFNATLVSLPKVFAVRLEGLADSPLAVGAFLSVVYTFGAFSQILVGFLLDRFSLRTIMITVSLVQIPFLFAAAQSANGPLLVISALMMFTIFGAIPITDTLVARSTVDSLRSRVYALKYLGSLGVSSLAVPVVSLIYATTADFYWLFLLFAGLSVLIAASGLWLPGGPPPQAAPQAAPAGGG